ncbi:hypothetical protein Hanom_Chr15g01359481 [Helianthus anomalus]
MAMIVTPQPITESSGRGTKRIRLFKRIHNNYIAIIFITFCRIEFRPKRVVRKSSTPFQRRKQGNGCVHSLYHTIILLYIDFTTFRLQGKTGNTSVSDLNSVTNEMTKKPIYSRLVPLIRTSTL